MALRDFQHRGLKLFAPSADVRLRELRQATKLFHTGYVPSYQGGRKAGDALYLANFAFQWRQDGSDEHFFKWVYRVCDVFVSGVLVLLMAQQRLTEQFSVDFGRESRALARRKAAHVCDQRCSKETAFENWIC